MLKTSIIVLSVLFGMSAFAATSPKTETVCTTQYGVVNGVNITSKYCVVKLVPAEMQKRLAASEHSEKTNR